jgi:hypothetical protein
MFHVIELIRNFLNFKNLKPYAIEPYNDLKKEEVVPVFLTSTIDDESLETCLNGQLTILVAIVLVFIWS